MSAIGKAAGGRFGAWMIGLSALLVLFVVLMAAIFAYVNIQVSNDNTYIDVLGEQRVLYQRVASSAIQAAEGEQAAFSELLQARDRFRANLNAFREGDAELGVSAMPSVYEEPLAQLEQAWQPAKAALDDITGNTESLTTVANTVDDIRTAIPELSAKLNESLDAMRDDRRIDRDQVYDASLQLVRLQRIDSNLRQLQAGAGEVGAATDEFGRDVQSFGQVLNGLLEGSSSLGIEAVDNDAAQDALQSAQEIFQSEVAGNVGTILDNAPALFEVSNAARNVDQQTAAIEEAALALESAVKRHVQQMGLVSIAGYVLGALALAALFFLGFILVRDTQRRLAATTEQNRRNQRAILQLLDEMSNLADGDLTVHATVTEDITGAIADSVNYAIDALRELVSTINTTAVEVSSAAEETQATASRLADASNQQANQIGSASSAVSDMAKSIEEVSEKASESAQVARNAVSIAGKGADTVQRTIKGMDDVREQIQDTSKRIKRLGESSQEIGDIVGLIDEIADQTNILALNAAIQASMAGEAGRGFAVVADEVQRLAERSSNATKQIDALVKGIQADTNEAVISMEQTTTNVVSGANLSQEAGEALEEIQGVSNTLEELIESISESSQQQASVAANVSETMQTIQEITMQTLEGTNQTASSIGNLTELSNELRKSVAGFKLPTSTGVY
jgi:twitching motility protein PilJ